jgi:hypothetical protein
MTITGSYVVLLPVRAARETSAPSTRRLIAPGRRRPALYLDSCRLIK